MSASAAASKRQPVRDSTASVTLSSGIVRPSKMHRSDAITWLADGSKGAAKTVEKGNQPAESFSTQSQGHKSTRKVQLGEVVTIWPHLW